MVASEMKLRPASGKEDSESVCSVNWFRVSAVFTSGLSPLTVTCSETAPTSSAIRTFSV